MDLHWLKPLLGRPSPFTTVYLDVTRADAAGEAEATDRWKAVRRQLERDGAPARVLDEIGDLIATPTGVRGPHGRVIVSDADSVVVDRVLAEPPAQAHAVFGPVPALLPPAGTDAFAARMGAVPALGEHSRAILGELGYAADEIAEFRARGVV